MVDEDEQITQLTIVHPPPSEALKFLLHFLGDLHEPLHIENLAEGGNDIPVLFNNKTTNLHSLWDYDMLLHYTNSSSTNEVETAKRFAEILFRRDDGIHKMKRTSQRVSVEDIDELVLQWARESNAWICKFVLRDGIEGVQGKELGGSYYDWAIWIMEQQIIRAGWRLGAVINTLAELQEMRAVEGDEEVRGEL